MAKKGSKNFQKKADGTTTMPSACLKSGNPQVKRSFSPERKEFSRVIRQSKLGFKGVKPDFRF
jgi:hypothetical protein